MKGKEGGERGEKGGEGERRGEKGGEGGRRGEKGGEGEGGYLGKANAKKSFVVQRGGGKPHILWDFFFLFFDEFQKIRTKNSFRKTNHRWINLRRR